MSQYQVTLTDVQTDLAYLLGESTLPTSGSTEDTTRTAFAQRGLERVYRYYKFPFSQANATLANVNGAISLPSDIRFAPDLDVRVVMSGSGDDYVFDAIPYDEQDNYQQGDYKYWLTESAAGAQTLNTKESSISVPYVAVRYTVQAPAINASIATAFPSSMVIAKAALIYYRQAEDPLADTTPEEREFQKELQEILGEYRRNQPQRRMKSISEISGVYTGDPYSNAYEDSNNSRGD